MHQNQPGRFASAIINHQKSAGISRLVPQTEQNNNSPAAQTKKLPDCIQVSCVFLPVNPLIENPSAAVEV